jgi:cytosine/adenosine deaminase-related metal-dependent hydrolase
MENPIVPDASPIRQHRDGDLTVAGGHLLCGDGSLRRADVRIEAGTIVEVRAGIEPRPGVRTLDATEMLLAPGLVNAHMHSGENFNPGLYENLPLDLWFVRSHQVTRDHPPSREAIYVRTLLGAMLMLRSGTTAAVDFLYEAPQITLETLEPVVAAYRDAGLRATILLGVADLPYVASLPAVDAAAGAPLESPPAQRAEIMKLARAAVDRFHEPEGMIGIGLGPSAPQRCSPELLQETMALARERGLVWQTHVQETRTQVLTARSRHGQSFVELLQKRGLLGPEATLVHTVWLTDRDIEIMRDTDTSAVHCLVSNLRLGDGVARLPALMRAGVRVALGTDGRGCMETLDMLELARVTALVHKVRGGDRTRWPTAVDALRMATRDASACAGHGDRLGRIEPGARGDLILIPRSSPAFIPMHHGARQLVYGAAPGNIHSVVVDGRLVVQDGRVLGIDLPWLMARVEAHAGEAIAGERSGDSDTLERLVGEVYAWAEAQPLELDSYLPG